MTDPLAQLLAGRTATWLVTGVAGFIGSNLLEALLRSGQRVVGLDDFSTGHRRNLEQVEELVGAEAFSRFRFVEGDVARFTDCEAAVKGVDFVLHHAALGSVPASIERPLVAHASNTTGFVNMLVAARDANVQRFVYAASSSTYGNEPGLPKVETMVGRPLSPYAATKYANEIYAESFAQAYGFRSVGLRYFNIFGPRQDPDGAYAAVIPKWIAALLRRETVTINGDGETSRDFCFVENVVQMNVRAALLDSAAVHSVFNVGGGERTTLNQLFDYLRDPLSLRVPELASAKPLHADFRAGDVRHSVASIDKAKNELGYVPSGTVREGLARAMDWYVAHLG